MKLTITTLIAAVVASMAWVATAQDETAKKGPREGGRGGQGGQGGQGGRGGNMLSRLPVYKALDKDGDGALSKEEIAAASASLLTLDKDGNGILSKEEIAPAFGGRGGDRAGGRQRGGAEGGTGGGRPERPKRPASE